MVVKDSRLALASKVENKEQRIKKENINFILDLTKYQEAQSTRRYQKRKLRMTTKRRRMMRSLLGQMTMHLALTEGAMTDTNSDD